MILCPSCHHETADIVDKCCKCNHHFVKNPINEEVLLDMYETKESDNLQRVTNKTNFYKEYWNYSKK